MQDEIEQAAFAEAQRIEAQEQIVVGVNRNQEPEAEHLEILRVDPAVQQEQINRLAEVRAGRDQVAVKESLEDVRAAAKGTGNLLVPMREALKRMATVGEVCNVLRDVFGVYRPKR
jgi:methylmalonyl-CoA mutase N-terminal domain/subunit